MTMQSEAAARAETAIRRDRTECKSPIARFVLVVWYVAVIVGWGAFSWYLAVLAAHPNPWSMFAWPANVHFSDGVNGDFFLFIFVLGPFVMGLLIRAGRALVLTLWVWLPQQIPEDRHMAAQKAQGFPNKL